MCIATLNFKLSNSRCNQFWDGKHAENWIWSNESIQNQDVVLTRYEDVFQGLGWLYARAAEHQSDAQPCGGSPPPPKMSPCGIAWGTRSNGKSRSFFKKKVKQPRCHFFAWHECWDRVRLRKQIIIVGSGEIKEARGCVASICSEVREACIVGSKLALLHQARLEWNILSPRRHEDDKGFKQGVPTGIQWDRRPDNLIQGESASGERCSSNSMQGMTDGWSRSS